MLSLKQHLLDHLADLTGDRPALVAEKAAKMPLFLREHYQIQSAHLFGRRFLLALEAEGWATQTPGEYEKQSAALRTSLGETPVLVLAALPAYARNRMVRLGIPFIVPGSQVFLPTALMDLRERFSSPKPEHGKPFTPAAQCLVLYHLQRRPMDNLPLREVAQAIGYSPIMLTKVKDELMAAQVCASVRHGRAVVLQFAATGRELWEKAQPFLSSPVKKTHWVRWDVPAPSALFAGITALSRRTALADDRLPAYALSADAFQDHLKRGLFHVCHGPEDAAAKVECWSYDPGLFRENGSGNNRGTGTVDPLSLFLSLRESADERIQQQLETLVDQIAW